MLEDVVLGRPKGTGNMRITLNWISLCCDLRTYPEFEVPNDNSYIKYIICKDESLVITKENDDLYTVKYVIYTDKCKKEIKCQNLYSDTKLDEFLNRLLMEDWDWDIEGRINMFQIHKNRKHKEDNIELEEQGDNTDE